MSFGSFIIQELSLADKFKTMLGLRYDVVRLKANDHFLSDGDQSGTSTLNSFNPTFGLVYSVSDAWNLYGNISTSFETPTLGELSNNPTGEGGFNIVLEPQKANNYEIGFKGIANNKLKYEIALFTIDVKNEIVPFELEAYPGRIFYQNAGSTDRNGTEISLTYSLTKNIKAFLNYTFSDFKYDTFQTFDGKVLPGIPKHSTFLALNFSELKGFFGSLQNRIVGELFANNSNTVIERGYVVTNLKLGYQKQFINWHLEPFLGINNLFNKKYNDNIRINAFGGRFYEPAPRINFYGGIKIRTGK